MFSGRNAKRGAILSSLLVAGAMLGCSADVVGSTQESLGESTRPVCFTGECVPEVTPIYAGQHIEIGTVGVVSADGELIISIDTTDGWTFGLVHIYVGTDPVPTTRRGNVAPGRFPFHYDYDTPTWSDDIRIPLTGVACGESLTVAVHLEAFHEELGEETAWGWGEPFEGSQWGWYFYYDVCCGGEGTCVQSSDFWAGNPTEWPPYITKLGMGGNLYEQAELISLLSMDPSTDASIRLAQAWITMKLNWHCGVSVSDTVWNTMLTAGSWFYRNKDADGRLPYGVDPASAAGVEALVYAEVLEAFNAGSDAIPMCPPEL